MALRTREAREAAARYLPQLAGWVDRLGHVSRVARQIRSLRPSLSWSEALGVASFAYRVRDQRDRLDAGDPSSPPRTRDAIRTTIGFPPGTGTPFVFQGFEVSWIDPWTGARQIRTHLHRGPRAISLEAATVDAFALWSGPDGSALSRRALSDEGAAGTFAVRHLFFLRNL